jgi:hypothetical protein
VSPFSDTAIPAEDDETKNEFGKPPFTTISEDDERN